MIMSSENVLPTKELLLKTEELFDKDSDYFSLSKMIFKKELSAMIKKYECVPKPLELKLKD